MSRGRTIARLLAGSWRRESPPTELPPATAIEDVLPLLLDGGSAGLAWMRIRHSALASTSMGERLREAHRMQTLLAAVQRRQIAAALAALSAVDVTPLFAKGWTVARHYCNPGARAVGDIDLYVAPADHRRAAAALTEAQGELDLHSGIRQLPTCDFAAVAARAEAVVVEGQTARVLSPAEQLRLVCLHMLGHGAWRPLWLCDVAALVEAGGVSWDLCLAGAPRERRWIACAIIAARDLLDADVSSVPASVHDVEPPSWFEPAMLAAWGKRPHRREEIPSYFTRPLALPAALWHRWPNPIEATIDMNAEFDEAPRFPVQLSNCGLLVRRLASTLVRRHRSARET
jgi:hypothetical protein